MNREIVVEKYYTKLRALVRPEEKYFLNIIQNIWLK